MSFKAHIVTIWVGIVIGVGTLALSAVGRWVWVAVRDKFREWVREPVVAAQKSAEDAASHAVEMKEAIGTPNGQGDVVTMLTTSLGNQDRMFAELAGLAENDAQFAEWKVEHDAKDDLTRVDVAAIKAHLGIEETK